ncbi:hypothetical protein A9Q84_06465 [Halobacteriovorax marinus]|uniref:DUF3179 domain-containing protein n=1 Tax=Halobacteriovorax marinus TaxID=97084 RepID=A0A1Y5FE32_9BACT|nr:hypothetical protein A9Q84_06465 [Halobacteriovorax marinus]
MSAYGMNGFNLEGTLIPRKNILKGGPPRDGIPAINHPLFISSDKAEKIYSIDDYAIVVSTAKETKAYPISVLNWHEIVNDIVGDTHLVISYCPLCGTGMVFYSKQENAQLSFGVSGLLYQSDVLLYDKQTESLWSQLLLKSVSGKYKGSKLKIFPSMHVRLIKFLKENPKTRVLSKETGFSRDYSRNPYANYEKTNTLYFPINVRPKKYHFKEWSLIILSKNPVIVPMSSLKNSKGRVLIKTKGEKVLIQYNKETRELNCLGQVSQCVSGYFFALKTFYPQAKIHR